MKPSRSTLATTLVAFCAVLACISLLILTSEPASAQIASSVLNGTVMDESGAVMPNAKVTISSPTTGFVRSVVTNSIGSYSIRDLTPGVYSISVEADGFRKDLIPGLTLYVGQTSTQDFRLQPGTMKQEVSVSAQSTLLNTTNAQQGTVITATTMTQLYCTPLKLDTFIR
jgi:hypothetical protein